MLHRGKPIICDDAQRGENPRKKLCLELQISALNQLSYAGVFHTKACFVSTMRSPIRQAEKIRR
jgi:hypothetical protein